MKRKLYLALVLVLLLCGSALALSDKDYLRLKRNNKDFARADRQLTEVYEAIKDNLTAREFEKVKREQRNWIRTGRDAFARKRMKAGDSKAAAYTAATMARVDELRGKYLSDEEDYPEEPEDDGLEHQPLTRRQPDPEPEPEPESRNKNSGIAVEDIQGIYKNHAGTVLKIAYLGEVDENEVQVNFDTDNGDSHERWGSRGVFDGMKIELDTEDNGEAVLTFKNSTTANFKVDADFRSNGFFSEDAGIEGTYYKQ